MTRVLRTERLLVLTKLEPNVRIGPKGAKLSSAEQGSLEVTPGVTGFEFNVRREFCSDNNEWVDTLIPVLD